MNIMPRFGAVINPIQDGITANSNDILNGETGREIQACLLAQDIKSKPVFVKQLQSEVPPEFRRHWRESDGFVYILTGREYRRLIDDSAMNATRKPEEQDGFTRQIVKDAIDWNRVVSVEVTNLDEELKTLVKRVKQLDNKDIDRITEDIPSTDYPLH